MDQTARGRALLDVARLRANASGPQVRPVIAPGRHMPGSERDRPDAVPTRLQNPLSDTARRSVRRSDR